VVFRSEEALMMSVVIAAHNEGKTIGRCLDLLLADAGLDDLEVVVAANGCQDDTMDQIERRGVPVVQLPHPGKVAALNAAERHVSGFPRVYLDADSQMTFSGLRKLVEPLADSDVAVGGILASAPRRLVDTSGRPLIVRLYFRVLDLHPSYKNALFGRGVVALSARGRSRFLAFPDVVADDFFLDSLFNAQEKLVVSDVASVVEAPFTARDLITRLARVRRGNTDLRSRSESGTIPRPVEGLSWLLAAVRRDPSLAAAGAVYVIVTTFAVARARWGRPTWGSNRQQSDTPSSYQS
jgi:glycosyltransferase involved in cell wall biosynthesis